MSNEGKQPQEDRPPSSATIPPGPPAAAQAAALIREQMEIIVGRILYDTQELLRVGALGPDPVNVRTIVEAFANALERGDAPTFAHTYSRSARSLVPQINDQVLPYRLGLQIGAMFEGILRDTLTTGFAGDPALAAASVRVLEQLAVPAKLALLGEPREIIQWQAPRI